MAARGGWIWLGLIGVGLLCCGCVGRSIEAAANTRSGAIRKSTFAPIAPPPPRPPEAKPHDTRIESPIRSNLRLKTHEFMPVVTLSMPPQPQAQPAPASAPRPPPIPARPPAPHDHHHHYRSRLAKKPRAMPSDVKQEPQAVLGEDGEELVTPPTRKGLPMAGKGKAAAAAVSDPPAWERAGRPFLPTEPTFAARQKKQKTGATTAATTKPKTAKTPVKKKGKGAAAAAAAAAVKQEEDGEGSDEEVSTASSSSSTTTPAGIKRKAVTGKKRPASAGSSSSSSSSGSSSSSSSKKKKKAVATAATAVAGAKGDGMEVAEEKEELLVDHALEASYFLRGAGACVGLEDEATAMTLLEEAEDGDVDEEVEVSVDMDVCLLTCLIN